MNCHVCGQLQNDTEAMFCEECGVALCQPKLSATFPTAETLAEALRCVADLVEIAPEEQRAFVPQSVLRELRAWASASPRGETPTVVMMGEYRRGKSTLINRLLGQEIADVRIQSQATVLQIGQCPQHGTAKSIHYLACDAPLLQRLDLIETPAITKQDGLEVPLAIECALTAAAIVFCLDARQLLSANERSMIQHELLPLTQCPIVLAVTFLDQIPDEQDQRELRELLDQFVAAVDVPRLNGMMLAPGSCPQDALDDLQAWITHHVSASPTVSAIDPHQRLRTLLTFVEKSLPDTERESHDRLAQQREATLLILDREHRQAIAQAVSLFREQCSYLRGDLKAILKASDGSTYGFEAFSHVVLRLRDLLQKCGEYYLTDLQRSLRHDGAAGMRRTSETINPSAALTTEAPQLAAPRAPKFSQSNWKASALEAATVAMAVAIPGLTTLIGASVGLIAARSIRQANRQQTGGERILQTEHSLQAWLTETEPQLLRAFTEASEKVIEDIRQHVAQRFVASAASPDRAYTHSELRQAIAHCFKLLRTTEPSSHDHTH